MLPADIMSACAVWLRLALAHGMVRHPINYKISRTKPKKNMRENKKYISNRV